MSYNLTNSTSWAPVGEDAFDLFTERSNYWGIVFCGFGYGIVTILFFASIHGLLTNKRGNRTQWGILTYVVGIFAATTVFFAGETKWGEQMFIDWRNYPGGPIAFYYDDFYTPAEVVANAAYLVINVLSDGLVLYRCYLLFNFNFAVIAFPGLMYLGWVSLGLYTVFENSKADATFTSILTATAWVSLSMAVNLLVTLMIVGRLIAHRRKLIGVLGEQHARLYTSVIAMMVESAALTAVMSLLYVIFYAAHNPWMNSFVNVISSILTMSLCASPLLIIVRVAHGTGFSKDTMSTLNSKPTPIPLRSMPTVTIESKTHVDPSEHGRSWASRKGDESMTSVV